MARHDIFEIENDLLVINKDYVRGIPEYKIILERDKGGKGDNDGRKKLRAWKEFYYIKIVADRFAFPAMSGLNERETHVCGIKESGLEENFKPDDVIKAAINKYKELQDLLTPTINTVQSILQGLRLTSTVCKNMVKNIEATIELNENNKAKKLEEGQPIDLAADLAFTTALVSQIEQMNKIGNIIPKTIETLEKLEEKLAKEVSGVNIARGGKEIGSRANPK